MAAFGSGKALLTGATHKQLSANRRAVIQSNVPRDTYFPSTDCIVRLDDWDYRVLADKTTKKAYGSTYIFRWIIDDATRPDNGKPVLVEERIVVPKKAGATYCPGAEHIRQMIDVVFQAEPGQPPIDSADEEAWPSLFDALKESGRRVAVSPKRRARLDKNGQPTDFEDKWFVVIETLEDDTSGADVEVATVDDTGPDDSADDDSADVDDTGAVDDYVEDDGDPAVGDPDEGPADLPETVPVKPARRAAARPAAAPAARPAARKR